MNSGPPVIRHNKHLIDRASSPVCFFAYDTRLWLNRLQQTINVTFIGSRKKEQINKRNTPLCNLLYGYIHFTALPRVSLRYAYKRQLSPCSWHQLTPESELSLTPLSVLGWLGRNQEKVWAWTSMCGLLFKFIPLTY